MLMLHYGKRGAYVFVSSDSTSGGTRRQPPESLAESVYEDSCQTVGWRKATPDEDVSKKGCSSELISWILIVLVCIKASRQKSVENWWWYMKIRYFGPTYFGWWIPVFDAVSWMPFVLRRNTCWAYVEYIRCTLIWVCKEYQLKPRFLKVDSCTVLSRECKAAVSCSD